MSDLVCETVARRAGFAVSVGNWIAPDGSLILGWSESNHWKTINKHWSKENYDDAEMLSIMNKAVADGYLRLVFRADVCFQVGADKLDDLWSELPNYKRMMDLLRTIKDIEVHIFSKTFYAIGIAQSVLDKNLDSLQIREKK